MFASNINLYSEHPSSEIHADRTEAAASKDLNPGAKKLSAYLITSEGGHIKARSEKPSEYPERLPVPDRYVPWDAEFPGYRPTYYVSPVVLQNSSETIKGGWANPENFALLQGKEFHSFEGRVRLDAKGRPLNPYGRTGLSGRGLLGKWGANFAADPIVTRINPETEELEFLAILRVDSGEWAFPGGIVDDGELVTATLQRELEEETGIKLDFSSGQQIYRGYVDDRRNTDFAWIETTATHLHLPLYQIARTKNPTAGDDAKKAQWIKVDPSLKLYASHEALLRKTMEQFDGTALPKRAQDQIRAFRR